MTAPTYEKHTPTTDALDTLGSIIGPNEKRDAIHLAVEPAIAGNMLLRAGDHVTFDPATSIASLTHRGNGVGIVDPFLEVEVKPGEHFWLVVYPRQIASLRHVWEHPAFAPSRDLAEDAPATDQFDELDDLVATAVADRASAKADAEAWLRSYLLDEFGIGEDRGEYGDQSSFDDVMSRLDGSDDYVYIYGTDAHGTVPAEFIQMAEIYLGVTLPKEQYFSCSC